MAKPAAAETIASGRLRLVSANKATICVGTPLAVHKVLQLTFTGNGIFVQSPYFRRCSGIASRVEITPTAGPPYRFQLDEFGRVTSHMVKLAHHTNGRAHFSQDGRVRTEIRRQSFRLDNSIGSVFQAFAFWLRGFDVVPTGARSRDRAWIQFRMANRHLFGVSIEGEWRRRAALEANIDVLDGVVGPLATLVHRRRGTAQQSFFLAPRTGFESHVLVLSCTEATIPENVTDPLLIMMGGWDPHEVTGGLPEVRQTGCLAALYPLTAPEEMAARIGLIDFEPPTRGE